jgi:hypothetical protein
MSEKTPREHRAAIPFVVWIFIGIMLAVALILMPLAERPEPRRRPSIARPIPRAPSTRGSSRPTAPPSPPGPLAAREQVRLRATM